MEVFEKMGHLVSDNFSFVVWDGWAKGQVLEDRRYEDTPLNIAFPSLFACACAKEAWVGDVGSVEQLGDVGTLPSLSISMIGRWSI